MNLDEIERRTLGLARGAMAPTAEQSARVLAAVGARLLVPVAADEQPQAGDAGEGESPLEPVHSSMPGAAERTGASLSCLLGAARGPLVRGVLVAAIGGAGFAAGWFARERADGAEGTGAPQVAVAAPVSSVVVPAERPERHSPTGDGPAVPASANPPATCVGAGCPGLRARGRSRAPGGTAGAPGKSSAEELDRLAEEVRLLRQADHALRKQEPEAALLVIQELEARAPGGKLGEERVAARTLAECLRAPGPPSREAARGFIAAHPSSVYTGRIRVTCGLE